MMQTAELRGLRWWIMATLWIMDTQLTFNVRLTHFKCRILNASQT